MGLCYSQEVKHDDSEMFIYMNEFYEDLDKFNELPTISPILVRQHGYIKQDKRISINQIYRNEFKKRK